MNLDKRINLLAELGNYCVSTDPAWISAQQRAHAANGWFTPEFIGLAIRGIAEQYLQKEKLATWAEDYRLPDQPANPRTVGLTMAANIPLVGFHDFLSIFISGHHQLIRPSGRDDILIRHLLQHLITLDPAAAGRIGFAERLKGCDAYIATGSNNSARYFEYYFAKYPHIIRRNRTSIALLTGEETPQDLEGLADDVYQYFGLGCRNVTQIYVPRNYDFLPLLEAFRKYDYLSYLDKYKHNYDYQLTLLILNKRRYMSNESILLTENHSPFSPISVLNYAWYQPGGPYLDTLASDHPDTLASDHPDTLAGDHPEIQCIVGHGPGRTPFGQAQHPRLRDYADGIDTLQFLRDLP